MQQPIDAQALDSRHGRHGFTAVPPIKDEHRINQIVGEQSGLPHQAPAERVAAHTPHAGERKTSESVICHDVVPMRSWLSIPTLQLGTSYAGPASQCLDDVSSSP